MLSFYGQFFILCYWMFIGIDSQFVLADKGNITRYFYVYSQRSLIQWRFATALNSGSVPVLVRHVYGNLSHDHGES